MIDLKKMETQLDAVLAKETKESLEAWLFNERYKSLYKIIGRGGSFVSLSPIKDKIPFSKIAQPKFSNVDETKTVSNNYILAA